MNRVAYTQDHQELAAEYRAALLANGSAEQRRRNELAGHADVADELADRLRDHAGELRSAAVSA